MKTHNHLFNQLRIVSIGIDTYRENIIYMRSDCPICRSEGFTALTRLMVHYQANFIIATLNVVESELLKEAEAALSEMAMIQLGVTVGDQITISHLKPIPSLSDVRAKMYHHKIEKASYFNIINDITKGFYADIEIAAFIAACAGDNMDLEEITWLTEAMIQSGTRLNWGNPIVLDKHSVGGLPGNRTTPIIVPIVAAAGLLIPKTSSRAITSSAGTADMLETMTQVNLSIERIMEVVGQENGCFAWGGSVKLSPADDILIAIEKALDVDSSGQMIASVLSKKAAAGATHVLIDIPVGDTAKVRTKDEAMHLQSYFETVGNAIGLKVKVILSDGSQPVGRGIGPVMEALDVLAVLRNQDHAPLDLKDKAIHLSGLLLEFSGTIDKGDGDRTARKILENGLAYAKFLSICMAQGGFKEPQLAKHKFNVLSEKAGIVKAIENRKLAKVAKLAGAPLYPSAGIHFNAPIGLKVEKGQSLFTIFAESEGVLNYVIEYLKTADPIINIE